LDDRRFEAARRGDFLADRFLADRFLADDFAILIIIKINF